MHFDLLGRGLVFGLCTASGVLLSGCNSAGDPAIVDTDSSSSGSADPTGSMPATATTTATTETAETTDDPSGETSPGSTSSADTTGSGPTSADGSETGTPPVCGGASRCMDLAPLGWEGPVAVRDEPSGIPTDCGGSFGTLIAEFHHDLVEGEFSCDCDCGDPVDLVCESTTTLRRYSSSTCPFAVQTPTWTLDAACDTDVSGASNAYWRASPVEIVGGTCPPVDIVVHEPAVHLRRASLCSVSDPLEQRDCGNNQVCVPEPAIPFESQLCIYREGEHRCPSGFDVQHTYYAGLTDTRACADCTCGAPEGECSNHRAVLYNGGSCDSLGSGTISTNGNCIQSAALTTNSARLAPGALPDDLTCEPSVGTPEGEVTQDQPFTVCCQEI